MAKGSPQAANPALTEDVIAFATNLDFVTVFGFILIVVAMAFAMTAFFFGITRVGKPLNPKDFERLPGDW